ncbi:hypothetical protein QBC32DRAFT_376913 [Pseudoneurospora amorphoporcata]|uniref:Uncharacterized protein n=1 Tax=Pseudoneurospora amorphoporcata TaxID=241081 RepID=A0AAN6SDD8_9PEZI|nr:hypothetical protein QBC32DRAFT_376913 [Pseudoneurospora amorphoporcata]
MSSSLWSSGIAVHAYRIRNPDRAIVKAIIAGSFAAPINKTCPVLKAKATKKIHIADFDEDMSIGITDELDDSTASASIRASQTSYFSFPVIEGQDSSKDADIASPDKSHRTRKGSTNITSSDNSMSTVNSQSSKNTADTAAREYSEFNIANTNTKSSQFDTPGHGDESASSRDNRSPIEDETPHSTFESFPTFRLMTAPSSRGTPSDDDYNSDADSAKDPIEDLEIVHTLDREEYGLWYVLLANSQWYIYHDRRKISRMPPDEHEDFLACMQDPDAKPATTITD